MENKTVSVVIPVFNEEKTIAEVIEPLLGSESVSEIICVNDGSADKSLEILKSFGDKITLIDLRRNRGKGFAMAAGVKKAVGEIIVFLDADLLYLKKGHVNKLVLPLLGGKAEAALGVLSFSSTSAKPSPSLTGQRAYWKKDLIPHLKQISKTRYGAEIYLNSVFKKKKVAKVELENLVYLAKRHKMPFSDLPAAYLRQILEMSRTVAKVNGMKLQKIRSVFSEENVKSVTDFFKTLNQIEDKEILAIIKQQINSYFARHFKGMG